LTGNRRLGRKAASAIASAKNEVWVSVATVWETMIKASAGKLELPADFIDKMHESGFETLDIRLDHAIAAAELPRHHADPFDRMMIAQARLERLTIITRDRRFADYGVPILSA